jgi:hypothetical protein
MSPAEVAKDSEYSAVIVPTGGEAERVVDRRAWRTTAFSVMCSRGAMAGLVSPSAIRARTLVADAGRIVADQFEGVSTVHVLGKHHDADVWAASGCR